MGRTQAVKGGTGVHGSLRVPEGPSTRREEEHPTSNIEHPTPNARCRGGCWMFDVGCWMLDVPPLG
ncbi:MAG TPA: hypothetical protein VMU04_25090 [Candidatus Acidoferrum sp.]|nr:hypothetical protein [Candidatus Acidoferrum sp.]